MARATEPGSRPKQRSAEGVPTDLVEALRSALGERVVLDERARDEVAADATRLWRIFPEGEGPALPHAVVRPRSTEDVAAAVTIAAERGIPIVPFGGGSGLMGGAVSLRPGIVIDLRSMNRMVEVSPEDRAARVEAGVVLKDLNAELARHGFFCGHDPWSLPVATVGGAISTNGLGYLCGRYGSMGDQVLGLTAVLPSGDILRTPAVPGHSTGPDLKRLFIGAEGMLGIVTEAVLRIFPLPEARRHVAVAFPSFEEGFEATQEILTLGLGAVVADYGERYPVGGGASAPWPERATLQLVIDGAREEVDITYRRCRSVCECHGGEERPEEEARSFWEHRHDPGERFIEARTAGRLPWGQRPSNVRYQYLNVVVPASRMLEYRSRCLEALAREGAQPIETGFWGLPEYFAVMFAKEGQDEAGAGEVVDRLTDELLTLAQDMGGAMEQCHGVGLRWAYLMERQHGVGLDVLRSIKRALDPHGIMNPGKLGLDG